MTSPEAFTGRPASPGPHPGVLFFIDAIGLRPQIQDMVDRIAGWGYLVYAPNVFHREGSVADLAPTGDLREPGAREAFFAGVGPRIASLTPELFAEDLPGYLSGLRDLGAEGPIGVTGYCMGARLAVRAAGQLGAEVAAVGGFHGGRLATDDVDSPHLALPLSRAAYVFGHADQDGSMPPEQVDRLGAALREAGLEHTNEIYPDAPHGYTMNDTSMYSEAGAERHYRELQTLFAAHL